MNANRMMTRIHGRTATGVPRWAVWAAVAVNACVLPASVWRISALIFEAPLLAKLDGPPPGHGPILIEDSWWYIIGLTVLSESLAFMAFGLVSVWGEIVPRWIPGLGGRRVPPWAAVVPAGLGAAILMVFPYALVMGIFGLLPSGAPATAITHGWQSAVYWIAYLPLGLWGPLLAVLTVHYYRRRRGPRPAAV